MILFLVFLAIGSRTQVRVMLLQLWREEFVATKPLSAQKQREFLETQKEVIKFIKVPFKLEKVCLLNTKVRKRESERESERKKTQNSKLYSRLDREHLFIIHLIAVTFLWVLDLFWCVSLLLHCLSDSFLGRVGFLYSSHSKQKVNKFNKTSIVFTKRWVVITSKQKGEREK